MLSLLMDKVNTALVHFVISHLACCGQRDARLTAAEEGQRLAELEREEERERRERQEKARLRGEHALRKEHLAQVTRHTHSLTQDLHINNHYLCSLRCKHVSAKIPK